jgi:hypothetical protein
MIDAGKDEWNLAKERAFVVSMYIRHDGKGSLIWRRAMYKVLQLRNE